MRTATCGSSRATCDRDDFSAAIAQHEPRVALVNFGYLEPPAEIRRLSSVHPATRLVVLANYPTPGEARSCSPSARPPAPARRSRDATCSPRSTSPPAGCTSWHTTNATATTPLLLDVLTPREADVLDQLQLGRSNAEIALALSVSVETVRTHARSVFRKRGVKAPRELATLSAPRR